MQPDMKKILCLAVIISMGAGAAELPVGPGKKFARIEAAAAAASAGDTVLVFPSANRKGYEKVALYLTTPDLTIRAAAENGKRVSLSGTEFDYSGRNFIPRAIVQFNKNAGGCVLEGFEISGAHNGSHNGAGVRINQADNVTIRNCDIHNNDMGVMSNGDDSPNCATNQLIENCLIHHNGDRSEPGYNHNLYLSGGSVVLRGCEIFSSLTGHNVKSRAHRIEIRDCKIHDSNNREIDLVDSIETEAPGSDAIITGCTITKDTQCPGNHGVINFGREVRFERDGTLRLEDNTISTPFVTSVVQLSSPQSRVVFNRNTVVSSGSQKTGMVLIDAKTSTMTNAVEGAGNRISRSFAGEALDALGLKETTITEP